MDIEEEKERSLRYFAAAHRKIQRYNRLLRQTVQWVFKHRFHICVLLQADRRTDGQRIYILYGVCLL